MGAARSRSEPLYYFSHHKCATMYANSILQRVAAELGMDTKVLYAPEETEDALGEVVRRGGTDLIFYLDALWQPVDELGPVRGVHVVRDPRDILVSAYFSHLHSHQTTSWEALREHREELRDLSKEAGLYREIEFSSYVFQAMEGWEYEREGILELKFEHLAGRPYDFWLEAIGHLGLLKDAHFGLRRQIPYILRGLINQAERRFGWWPLRVPMQRIPAQRLLGIAFDNRYEKKSGGRNTGETDPEDHYRKGESGDWRNHLSDGHLEKLNRRFPRLLQKTGYAAPLSAGGDVAAS